ncbi:MAG: hypothetical protein ACR2G3_04050 [Solirubrobacterales bacterium]
MAKLRDAGLVTSVRGAHGGYRLALAADSRELGVAGLNPPARRSRRPDEVAGGSRDNQWHTARMRTVTPCAHGATPLGCADAQRGGSMCGAGVRGDPGRSGAARERWGRCLPGRLQWR